MYDGNPEVHWTTLPCGHTAMLGHDIGYADADHLVSGWWLDGCIYMGEDRDAADRTAKSGTVVCADCANHEGTDA